MNHITYQRAPLAELIVQFRWEIETVSFPAEAAQLVLPSSDSAAFDQWFSRLSNRIEKEGYTRLERLVPSGIPSFAHQVIFKYNKQSDEFPVIQFGHGVFSVNAGPPTYQSWDDFRSTVKFAVNILLETAPENTLEKFTHIGMRYIDGFDEKLREGKSQYKFITEDLGISLKFPIDFAEYVDELDKISPDFSFAMPIKGKTERKLNFRITTGRIKRAPSTPQTVMEISCSVDSGISSEPGKVLDILDESHKILHDWFIKITKKIDERMCPNSINHDSGE